jgi:DNA-binding GntR family transcriptional regulator
MHGIYRQEMDMIAEDLELPIEQSLSIREQVYKRVSDLILSGRIAPSDRIVENKLAKQLGVSRTPVREALHVLEMEGFLISIPRIGYQVKELQWEEVAEICEIRKVNETLAARWAMERITPELLNSLKENLDQAEADIKGGKSERFIARDADFHEILVRASGSRRLVEISQILRRHMFLYRIESVSKPDGALRAIESHRRIIDRLKERDMKGVEKAIHDHLDYAKSEIHHYLFEGKKESSG